MKTPKEYADEFWVLHRASNHRRPRMQEVKFIARTAYEHGIEAAVERMKAHVERVVGDSTDE